MKKWQEDTSAELDIPARSGDQLMSLGDLASRHLIAHTSETDIIAKSIEQVVCDTENETELKYLFEGVTRPYEELILRHARQQPRRTQEVYDEDLHCLKSGGWEWSREVTDKGTLESAIVYGFDRTKSGPDLKLADTSIKSLNDATARLLLKFRDNRISEVSLGWKAWDQPTQPNTLLHKLKNTELGEVIDTLIGPYSLRRAGGEQRLSFTLGRIPTLKSHRHARFTQKGDTRMWQLISDSDLQYHPEKNLFVRQHGLRDIDRSDNLTALNPAEAAIILHQMLSLIPTIDLTQNPK